MSKGAFTRAKYLMSKGGAVALVRVQPETETLTIDGVVNDQATGAATYPYLVRVGGGKREIGCRTRLVGFKFREASVPPGYKSGTIIYLPWFQPSTFSPITEGLEGFYTVDGTAYGIVVSGAIAEAGR